MSRSAAILLTLLLACRAFPQDPGENRIEAVVNGKAITMFDILARLAKDQIPYADLAESEKVRALKETKLKMADEILRKEAVQKSGIVINEEEYLNRKQQFIEDKGGRADFDVFLKEQRLTEEQFDTDFRARQEMNAWLSVVAGRGGAARLNRNLRPLWDVSVTPREMRRYYDDNLVKEFTIQDEVSVQVIQLYFSAGPRGTKQRKREDINGLRERLNTEADFGVLAQKWSDHASKETQGLIEHIRKGQSDALPEPVEAAVFADAVDAGAIVGPIEHVNSFWLVKVLKKDRARTVSFVEAQQKIERAIRNAKTGKAISVVLLQLVKEAYISPPAFKRELELFLGGR